MKNTIVLMPKLINTKSNLCRLRCLSMALAMSIYVTYDRWHLRHYFFI